MKTVHSLASLNDKLAGYSGRNLLINGDFSIWQRGEDQGVTGVGFFSDMWQGGSTGFRGKRKTDEATLTAGSYTQCTDAASTSKTIKNAIELKAPGNAGPFQMGAKVAVSFRARATVTNSSAYLALSFRDGYEGNNVSLAAPDDASMPLANTWYDVSGVVTMDKAPVSSNTAFILALTGTNVDANTVFDFADVQLELAEVPSDIEEIPVATQLARCQRYTQVIGSYTGLNGYVASATDVYVLMPLSAAFRDVPAFENSGQTFTLYPTDGVTKTVTFDSFSAGGGIVKLKLTGSGLSTNRPCCVRLNTPESIVVSNL